jgi:aspartate/methionine/tyrosine aminotransferase
MVNTFEYAAPAVPRSSPTMTAANLAAKAKALGVDVDVFTIGDLFPKPAEEIVQAWVKGLREVAAKTKGSARLALRPPTKERAYSETGGLPTLRAEIAVGFTKDTGLEVDASHVRCGNGGKGALTGAFAYLAGKSQPVVLFAAPAWPTNYDMFPHGTRIIEVDTNGRGIMSAAELTDALKQFPNPYVLLINAPSNPTGANYTPEEREAVLSVIKNATKDTIVAFDDPYGKLVFDREPYDITKVLQRGAVEKELFAAGRIAVFRTASKEYGMAGSRVGWLVTRYEEMLVSLQNYNESKGGGISSGSQLEVQAALMFGDSFITNTVKTLKEKRQIVIDGVAKLKYATMLPPQATIYAWIDFSKLKGKFVPIDAVPTEAAQESKDVMSDNQRKAGGFTIAVPADLMRYLVFVAGICPVQGTPFFAPGSPAAETDWHVRMSICNDIAELERGLAKLLKAESHLKDSAAVAA